METIKIILKGIGKVLGFLLESSPNVTKTKNNIGEYDPGHCNSNKDGYNWIGD